MIEMLRTTLPADGEEVLPAPAPDRASDLERLAALAGRHHLEGIEQRAETARLQATDDVVSVAVLGRFKAGKTSMLNQLLGEDLLPVQAIPATAVITRLRSGPRLTVRVFPTAGDAFAIGPAQLADWTTESGNPDNVRQVEWVQVESPALADLDHLVLVDTPGTGSSWEHNTGTSLRWLPNVGAALIAVNSTQPLSHDDVELVRLVQPHTPNIIVVLTKIDLLDQADLCAVTAHIRGQLHDRTGLTPPIVAISTAGRHAAQREQLRELLHGLNENHRTVSTRLAEHRTGQLTGECRSYLRLARAAATSTDLAVEGLRRALAVETGRLPTLAQQARAQLRPVSDAMVATTQDAVRRALPSVVRGVVGDLERELPTWKGTLAGETAHFHSWIEQALTEALGPFGERATHGLDGLLADGLEPVQRMGEAFLQRLERLVSEATGEELTLPVPELHPAALDPVDVMVGAIFDSHLEVVSWAVPMGLARGAVHRHFVSMVPWQVEKNLTRTAYRTAEAATRRLNQTLDDHIGQLAAIVRTCEQLVDSRPDDLAAIDADLEVLESLTL
ncbi:MAG: dynamin family protein [Propionibacteriaceae bacterium]|nr:dynamin family protein [Propionibacteriaceae bacterium]